MSEHFAQFFSVALCALWGGLVASLFRRAKIVSVDSLAQAALIGIPILFFMPKVTEQYELLSGGTMILDIGVGGSFLVMFAAFRVWDYLSAQKAVNSSQHRAF